MVARTHNVATLKPGLELLPGPESYYMMPARLFVPAFVGVYGAAVSLVACFLFPSVGRAQSGSNDFWRSQSIYQIVTDRFFDGDPSNNNAEGNYNSANSGSVHGGDFRGIEQKLDYIKALGATAIWISPVVLNGHGQFHGYAGRDFYRVGPHWGSLADLQHMIQAAHARGLLVIDDIIVNHGDDLISTPSSTFLTPPAGYNLTYRSGSLTYAAPFDIYNSTYNSSNNALTNLFHNYGGIPDYNTDQHVELGELSGLDDFRTESAYVRSNMAQIYQYWIGQAGFDGFRIDTVKHVEMGFWKEWSPAIHNYAAGLGKTNFFMFGEVYDGSDSKCGSYTGTQSGGAFALDSVLDYPLYFQVNSVFATATGNTKQLEDRYNSITGNYDPAAQMQLVTFLDNHDQPRFMSASGATADRLNVALAFLYTSRGVPCLYYGTEQAFNGTTDPNDREDMFDGGFEQGPSLGDNFNMTHPQFQMVARLNNFRRLYPALQRGTHVNKWNDPDSPGLFAYARRLGTQEVFVAFNTSGSAQVLPNRSTGYLPGTKIVNLFDTNEVLTVTATPEVPGFTVPATSAKIFVAQSDWRPLDPVIVSNFPPHDATSVATYSAVVLQFSKSMDTNSVQTNFVTVPAVSGSFAWSAARDTMTFTPASGLPGLTLVTVRVTNAPIDTVSGNAMYAPFEMRFKTAVPSNPDFTPPTISIVAPATNAFVAGNVMVSGTAGDNVALQKVEVRLDGGAWATATGTASWNFTLNTSNFLNGPHLISARATDTAGNLTTNSISVRFFNVPGAYVQRISGGNPASVTDCTNAVWVSDQPYTVGSFGYSGGATGAVSSSITGICASAQTLYGRERYSTGSGGFYYQFDCPAGIYEITLLEAETYWTGVGKRVFNVFVQGAQVLTNFDIYAAAGGGNLPVSRVFTSSVTNAQLKILFTEVVDHARVSGVQVRKVGDVYSDSDGIPDWWRLAYFGRATGQAGDNSRGGDDADGDGASNYQEYLAATNPQNPASLFRVISVAALGSDIQVTCASVTNRTYQLQRRETPPGSSWTHVASALVGNGGSLILTDAGGATNAAKYYRVQAH